jgi:hypothetical protein
MINIKVYLDTGNVHSYFVSDPLKGREHAAAIIASGYRHSNDNDDLEWFPPHRIVKVVVEKGSESSKYKDSVSAT